MKYIRRILGQSLLAISLSLGLLWICQPIWGTVIKASPLLGIVGGLSILLVLPIINAYLLDVGLADPTRYHPIVGMGQAISWGEQRLNKGRERKLKGGLYNGGLTLLTFFSVALVMLASIALPLELLINWATSSITTLLYLDQWLLWGFLAIWVIYFLWISIGGYLMLSGTTLIREVSMVFEALEQGLDLGRKQVGRIVGRDTQTLSAQEVRTAALETLSENLSDGVVAPLFWWALLGLPGMVAYKMINTQDSMVGYRSDRYRDYGYMSAKVDDLANYLPARLTALCMLLVAGRLDLLGFVWRHGRKHLSPNSGYPEAALAGILGCRFGGAHDYFGQTVDKPYIGEVDRELNYADLEQAVRINRRTEWLVLLLAVFIGLIVRMGILILLIDHITPIPLRFLW